MTLAWNFFLLIVGFVVLIKAADIFVEGASSIARKFKIPQVVIGLTVVAFGTSAPEAAVSISAALKGTSGIAVGNILGSNIMNILLILGITACMVPLAVQKSTLHFDMPFLLLSTVALVTMGYFQEKLNKISGIILWTLLIIFLVVMIRQAMKEAKDTPKPAAEIGYKKNIWLLILVTLLGLVGVVWGSDVAVDSASYIAKTFGMSDRIIGLTIVAFGTSLPELFTSVMAARKGNTDIAIGNIVGSNIFNILFVVGTSALIIDIPYGRDYFVDGLICIFSVVLLIVSVIKKKALTRTGGIIMLCSFVAYFAFLFIK